MLTLRHGNRCRVEGNFFLGKQKQGSGGIRIIGEDHVVVNNYIDGVMQGGFWITSGIPNSPLVGYFQARNCLVAFNTVVGSRGPCIELAAGLGASGRTLAPEGITVANNLFVIGAGCALLKGTHEEGYRWIGNVVSGPGVQAHAGFRLMEGELALVDGLRRLPPVAHVLAAEGSFPDVQVDIDGPPRVNPVEVGCDQRSTAAIVTRPLTAADSGPAWRRTAQLAENAAPAGGRPAEKGAAPPQQDRPQ
jgi:poly(beta-D-mannuronate) lyase